MTQREKILKLKARRERNGISVEDVATQMGISRHTIYGYEGFRRRVHNVWLKAWTDALAAIIKRRQPRGRKA